MITLKFRPQVVLSLTLSMALIALCQVDAQTETSSRRQLAPNTVDKSTVLKVSNTIDIQPTKSVVTKIIDSNSSLKAPTSSSRRSHKIPFQTLETGAKNKLAKVSLDSPAKLPVKIEGFPPQSGIGMALPNGQQSTSVTVQTGKPSASTVQDKRSLTQPVAKVAKRIVPPPIRKPMPKLVDPEQFRVKKPSQIKLPKLADYPDQDISPAVDQEKERQVPRAGKFSAGQDEMRWLDKLPRPSLAQGVRGMSMQRATNNQQVNSILNYSSMVSLASDYRQASIPTIKTWRSPNLSHRPVYFEDANLERYGNGFGRMQPVVSGVKFFSTAMLLPYHVGKQPPHECVYEMGYYRPGDCNPAYRVEREFSQRGLFYQLMTFGLVFGGL